MRTERASEQRQTYGFASAFDQLIPPARLDEASRYKDSARGRPPKLSVSQPVRGCLSGAARVRVFSEFAYRTQTSWSRWRRVIGKAEVMAAGDNPRFVVTNLPADGFKGDEDRERFRPPRLYEERYCARGDMENQLKQQVLDLRADRLSTPT